MSEKKPIRIVIPDAGPLISLACGGALDLLFSFKEEVRIVLTDVVAFESSSRSSEYADAKAIQDFIKLHKDRIEVLPTTIGSLALADLERKRAEGLPAHLSKDLGELSITNFIISLRSSNPGEPTLVLIEDDWFEANAYAVPGNVHLLSTSAWLDGLEELKIIESAAEIRAKIQAARPYFRSDYTFEKQAEKIEEGTEWQSATRPAGG